MLEVEPDVILAKLAQAQLHVVINLVIEGVDLRAHAAQLVLDGFHAVLDLALAREVKEAMAALLALELVQTAVDFLGLSNEPLALEDLRWMGIKILLLDALAMVFGLLVKRVAHAGDAHLDGIVEALALPVTLVVLYVVVRALG